MNSNLIWTWLFYFNCCEKQKKVVLLTLIANNNNKMARSIHCRVASEHNLVLSPGKVYKPICTLYFMNIMTDDLHFTIIIIIIII